MCHYSERPVARAGAGDNSLLSLSTFREVAMIPYSDNWLSCMEIYLYFTISGGNGEPIWYLWNKRLISKRIDHIQVLLCRMSLWRPVFDSRSVHVGFMVDKV
jgi:hypothetical protein